MICVAHHSFYRGARENFSMDHFQSLVKSIFCSLASGAKPALVSSFFLRRRQVGHTQQQQKVTLSSYNNWWLSFESFWNGSILPHLGAPSQLVLSSTPRQAKANQPQRSMSSLKRVEPFKKTDRSWWLVLPVERNLTFFLSVKYPTKRSQRRFVVYRALLLLLRHSHLPPHTTSPAAVVSWPTGTYSAGIRQTPTRTVQSSIDLE